MSGKKTRPLIGKLLTAGNRSGFMEAGSSPRTPLDFKILSPRGIVTCDVGGIGLGIVAALEKSGDDIQSTSRCISIPVTQPPKFDVDDESLEEEYTIVTRHMPNNSYTKVYDGGFVYEGYVRRNSGMKEEGCSLFDISPARVLDVKGHPEPDFLSFCHLCKKKLHGKDIYMYRGEKAFCSIECRCREISMEEMREKRCGTEAVSSSPCGGDHVHGRIFSTGIFAI
ncbi:FCS-Like Zinc finger 14 [Lactuca sativa]|uniref:FLZ-type domain-containing protein n=1 Tax=Lactuca sativa TaxID=4236 RepID=A0A9R1X8S3_LACSA|nr:FCS-Like Zinc finger 14 [Lactuca sativa]KAJ0205105.1 hypothetical protein LSAT_V11C500279260 [Lactuca sativa]